MIYYLVKEYWSGPIYHLLAGWANELMPFMRVIGYERFWRYRKIPLGTYIFSDLERLTRKELEKTARACQALMTGDSVGRQICFFVAVTPAPSDNSRLLPNRQPSPACAVCKLPFAEFAQAQLLSRSSLKRSSLSAYRLRALRR